MIIQALYQRYVDLSSNPDSGISPRYFSRSKVSYRLEIDANGNLVQVLDMRDDSAKKPQPIQMNVPEQPARSSGIKPYFLCDKAEYFLGYYSVEEADAKLAKKATDALQKYEALRQLAREVLDGVESPEARAVLAFYEQWDPAKCRDHPQLAPYRAELDKGIDTNMVFWHAGRFVHEDPAVRQAWIRYCERQDAVSDYNAQCLVTGESPVPIARLHDKIKGVKGTQAAGASLVSFNFRSVESYGKEDKQSYNSPVSRSAAFGYTTALNHLLNSARNRIQLGDMTVVFWSGQASVAEETEGFLLDFVTIEQTEPTEDTGTTTQIKDALNRIRRGQNLTIDMIPHGDTPFYVLALSPNNARVAVRFFWNGSFGEMVQKLGQHAADLALVSHDGRVESTPTMSAILAETLKVSDDGKRVGEVSKSMEGDLLRAVILGTAYPHTLYTGVLNRVRADGTVDRRRAAILKAYLSRYSRLYERDHLKEGLTMSLNQGAAEPAYRLGRLFAVLERAQQEAAGGANKLNATIKDRYFNAAASNPGAVFPLLMRLSQHHMSKAKYGDKRDREMVDILNGIQSFPSNLDLHRQGLFILGYYHQKLHYKEQILAALEARDGETATSADDESEA